MGTQGAALKTALTLGLLAAAAGCADSGDANAWREEQQQRQDWVDTVNGLQVINGLAANNGLMVVNGLTTTNGLAANNGLVTINGLAVINGLPTINGLSSSNGLETVNGLTVTNGLASINGLQAANGLYIAKDGTEVETCESLTRPRRLHGQRGAAER